MGPCWWRRPSRGVATWPQVLKPEQQEQRTFTQGHVLRCQPLLWSDDLQGGDVAVSWRRGHPRGHRVIRAVWGAGWPRIDGRREQGVALWHVGGRVCDEKNEDDGALVLQTIWTEVSSVRTETSMEREKIGINPEAMD